MKLLPNGMDAVTERPHRGCLDEEKKLWTPHPVSLPDGRSDLAQLVQVGNRFGFARKAIVEDRYEVVGCQFSDGKDFRSLLNAWRPNATAPSRSPSRADAQRVRASAIRIGARSKPPKSVLERITSRLTGVGLFVQPHTKSVAGMRTLKIPNWAMDVLRKRRGTATSEWAFPSSSGTLRDPDNTRKALRGVLEGSEWEGLHPHAFRHLVATQLDAAGLTAREIADYLGHAQVSMTRDVYMNRKSVGHRAADALEGLKPTE